MGQSRQQDNSEKRVAGANLEVNRAQRTPPSSPHLRPRRRHRLCCSHTGKQPERSATDVNQSSYENSSSSTAADWSAVRGRALTARSFAAWLAARRHPPARNVASESNGTRRGSQLRTGASSLSRLTSARPLCSTGAAPEPAPATQAHSEMIRRFEVELKLQDETHYKLASSPEMANAKLACARAGSSARRTHARCETQHSTGGIVKARRLWAGQDDVAHLRWRRCSSRSRRPTR